MSTIEVTGSLGPDSTAGVTVCGRERIAAVLAAANRHLTDTDEVVTSLVEVVKRDEDAWESPDCYDKFDAQVLADVLDDMRNGDDGSGHRAATRLRKMATAARRITCPTCDGEGEVDS